jgi:hypothetical protein
MRLPSLLNTAIWNNTVIPPVEVSSVQLIVNKLDPQRSAIPQKRHNCLLHSKARQVCLLILTSRMSVIRRKRMGKNHYQIEICLRKQEYCI